MNGRDVLEIAKSAIVMQLRHVIRTKLASLVHRIRMPIRIEIHQRRECPQPATLVGWSRVASARSDRRSRPCHNRKPPASDRRPPPLLSQAQNSSFSRKPPFVPDLY